MFGREFTDQVTIAPGLVITGQSIGAATLDNGFQGLDGILGFVHLPALREMNFKTKFFLFLFFKKTASVLRTSQAQH